MKYSFIPTYEEYSDLCIESKERDLWGEQPKFKLKFNFQEWPSCCANTILYRIMFCGCSQNDPRGFASYFNKFDKEVLQDEINNAAFFKAVKSADIKKLLKDFGYSRGIYYTVADRRTLRPFNSFFMRLLNDSLKTDFIEVCSTKSEHGTYRINTYFAEL